MTKSIIVSLVGLLASISCASGNGRIPIDISKLPPIIIAGAPAPPTPAPPAKPRATLAFQVVDSATGMPVSTAFAIYEDGVSKQADEQGYIARELEAGGTVYAIRFEADDYTTMARRFQLGSRPDEQDGAGNRQFTVRLTSSKPVPPPPPPPTPVTPAPPPPEPQPHVASPKPQAPSCAEFECVRQVAAAFPALLTTNTYESCLEFTQLVLDVLGPEWGHVGKTAGESQSVPKGFTPIDVSAGGLTFRITGVSHDAIKHRVTGQVIDILANASANSDPNPAIHGPARIQWEAVPPAHWRVNNPFIPAVPVR